MPTTTRLQDLATTARKAFVRDRRTDGSEFWRTIEDDRPEWVQDLCHAAHGDMWPDDWRYHFIVEALDALAETADPDDILMEPDVYTHELTAWLASRADRYEYCDLAMEEGGIDYTSQGILAALMDGQLREKEEVLALVREQLEAMIENDDMTEIEANLDTDADTD